MNVSPAALLRHPAAGQALRFFVVGLGSTAVTVFVVYMLKERMGVQAAPANALGYVGGMIQGFVLNRMWTFRGAPNARSIQFQIAAFIGVNLLCGGLFTQVATWLDTSAPFPLPQLAALCLSVPMSFLLNRFLVFNAR